MFTLQTKNGQPVLMRDGSPFTYSTRELANLGKRLLDADRKDVFTVVRN
jgi:hypothetical protein